MEETDARSKAEQLNTQAELRLIKIQAHIKVYGGRDKWLTRERAFDAQIEQEARNGIEFIEAALKLFPNDPKYLNTYALLLVDGLGLKKVGLEVLTRAAQFAPDDIQLKQNIRSLQRLLQTPAKGCLVVCVGG
ncbi:MAG: hypothetical protein WCE51_08235, partial [Chthoniobacterales bacterium]